jgi:hypothetical protein
MAYTKLIPRFTAGANVEESSHGSAYRLSIPAGSADKYRLAQLDDYTQVQRSQFPLRYPITLSLSARASSATIPGTWGLGLWNDPFGLSLGFGGNLFRLPMLPNAVWFFGASEESYLSFKDASNPSLDTGETPRKIVGQASARPTGPAAANGFLAQTFRSPRFHPALIPAGLALPFSREATRRWLGKVIDEDGIALSVDVTQWHRYRLDWRETGVSLEVDEVGVFKSHVSPHPPLGLVIWIDNQYAAFTPEGKIGFGVLENPEPAWLEIKDIELV